MKKNVIPLIIVSLLSIILVVIVFNNKQYLIRKFRLEYVGGLKNDLLNQKEQILYFFNGERKIKKVSINTSLKNYLILQDERKKMLNNHLNNGTWWLKENIKVNGEIKYDIKENEKIKIRLFGKFQDHYRDDDLFSFRVEYKTKEKNEWGFNFLRPWSRDYNMNFIINSLYKKLFNGPYINYEPVNLSFNNNFLGLYFAEDFFSKTTLERNNIKQGAIFTIENDSLNLKYSNDINFNYDASSKIKLINKHNVINIFSFCLLINNYHPLIGMNLHFLEFENSVNPLFREGYIVPIKDTIDVERKFNEYFNRLNFTYDEVVANQILKNIELLKQKIPEYLSSKEYLEFKKLMIGSQFEFDKREELLLSNLKKIQFKNEN